MRGYIIKETNTELYYNKETEDLASQITEDCIFDFKYEAEHTLKDLISLWGNEPDVNFKVVRVEYTMFNAQEV